MAEALPGLDLGRLAAWLDTGLPGFHGPLSARLITGGRSNLTYVVTDGTSQWIMRRPPLGHVLATAHDVEREHRVMSALRDTAAPVPRMYGLCTDVDVIGAPFYVMELVTGSTYRRRTELEQLGATRTRSISERLIDTLAALRTVNPDEAGLRDLSRFGFYLGLAAYKLAGILEGIHFRYLHGQTVGDGCEGIGEAVHPLLELGLDATKDKY